MTQWLGKRRPLLLLATLVLLIVLTFSACSSQDDEGEAAEKAVPVDVLTVTQRPLSRYITFTAQTEPKEQVQLMAEVAGQVTSVPVSVGQWVEAGTVVVQLDASTLNQQVVQAQGAVHQAQAGLEDAQAALASAQREYDRMKPLYEAGALAEKDWDQLVDGLERARLGAQVQAPGQLQQAEAGLALAQSQLNKASIRAPIAGEVAAILTSPGNQAAPGNPVATIVQRHQIELTTVLSDRQVVQVTAGMPVEVTMTAIPGQVFTGTVETVAPAADPQAGGFPVTVLLPNEDGVLRPGMVAEVRIPVEEEAAALAVPSGTVIQRNGQSIVFVVEEGKAVQRVVQTGLSDGEYTAITEGLDAGEQLIVSGQHFVADGMAVDILQLADEEADADSEEDAPEKESTP